jgi:hypothetical protein
VRVERKTKANNLLQQQRKLLKTNKHQAKKIGQKFFDERSDFSSILIHLPNDSLRALAC